MHLLQKRSASSFTITIKKQGQANPYQSNNVLLNEIGYWVPTDVKDIKDTTYCAS